MPSTIVGSTRTSHVIIHPQRQKRQVMTWGPLTWQIYIHSRHGTPTSPHPRTVFHLSLCLTLITENQSKMMFRREKLYIHIIN